MIPGPALAAWLGDRDAQGRTRARMDRAVERWSRHSWITRLDRQIALLDDRSPENLVAAAREFMLAGGEDAMLRDLIAECKADPFFRPPFHPLSSEVHHSLLLYHHPDLSVSLGVTGVEMLASKKLARGGDHASINFTGFTTLIRFLKSGGATVSFWEIPEIKENFTAAESGKARMSGCRIVEDGDEILIDGRHQSFVIEHASADILFFQAVARTQGAPVGVEYDSDSLEYIGASSTDEASSRLQMMVSLIRAMDRTDAMPLMEEALAAPQFYARWHVMREMLALDAQGSLPTLRRMAAKDPHPDVRAAAAQTLDAFFPEGAECPA